MAPEHSNPGNGFSNPARKIARSSGRINPRAAGTSPRSAITLNQFELFEAAAKWSSLTKAAKELRVSQPSMSQQLKQLENHTGYKLYRRVSKGIQVTDEGRTALQHIQTILHHVGQLGGARSKRPVVEVLRVGGTFSASAVLLPRLLARLQRCYPKAQLEFRTTTSAELERFVAAAEIDVAVTDRLPVSAGLISIPLRREKAVVFVPLHHRLARRRRVTLADILAEPLIIRGGRGISGSTANALKRLQQQGLSVKIGMRCDGPAAIKAAVRQKMGVGIAFEDSIRTEIHSREFKVLRAPGFEVEARSFVIYSQVRALSPIAREFLQLLRSADGGAGSPAG